MKYKLIKEYPSSPLKDTIVTKDERGQYVAENPLLIFDEDSIVMYPEFWEEVKEKEYTILSYMPILDENYNRIGNHIHSVRRESDGEVFTLGDKLDFCDNAAITEIIIDSSFNGGMRFKCGSASWCIETAKKAPIRKPILITEDGKEIFEGDNYSLFSVCTKANWMESRTPCDRVSEWSKEWKHFHTKEAREEYIKWNKPMYSLNDINSSGAPIESVTDVIEELEKLGRK